MGHTVAHFVDHGSGRALAGVLRRRLLRPHLALRYSPA